jgi:hypothetical protein
MLDKRNMIHPNDSTPSESRTLDDQKDELDDYIN